MVLVKILKRKDASSIIVAIVVGSLLLQFIQTLTNKWAIKLSHVNYGSEVVFHWKEDLLMPVLWLLLGLIVLEILGWIYVLATGLMKRK
jgi:hypothetical protein